jgi:hypothetical protein
MFSFLNKFFLDLKKKQLLVRFFNIWNYNMLNYKNYKVMSYLSVLINQFDLISNHKLLVISTSFSLDAFVKVWFISFLSILFLVLYII